MALAENRKLLALEEESKANSHSSILTILIQRIFKKVNHKISHVDAIAVSEGPGSFTGLRIGVAAAKGLCYALDKPLIAVPTLKAMARGAIEEKKDMNSLYCPMIDSIKNEIFASLYSHSLNEILSPTPLSADIKDFIPFLEKKTIFAFGSGIKKISPHKNLQPLKLPNSSKNMLVLSENLFLEKIFSPLDEFEPLYLKKFISLIAT